MGQAKRRGSYDERKVEAVKREYAMQQQRTEELKAAAAALTPEQKKERRANLHLVSYMLRLASEGNDYYS